MAVFYSSGVVTPREVLRLVLQFPFFKAMTLALLLKSFASPPWLVTVLQRLGDSLTPLALASIGFQLSLHGLKGELKPLGLSLL